MCYQISHSLFLKEDIQQQHVYILLSQSQQLQQNHIYSFLKLVSAMHHTVIK